MAGIWVSSFGFTFQNQAISCRIDMASDVTDDGPHDEEKTVTIRTFGSHEAAELAVANLEAHGIECLVHADDCGGMYPNLTTAGGVRLLVRAAEAEAAIALLNAQASPAELNQIETEAVASPPPETVPLKKLAWGQILFSIVIGVILCLLYQWVNNSEQQHIIITPKTENAMKRGFIAMGI